MKRPITSDDVKGENEVDVDNSRQTKRKLHRTESVQVMSECSISAFLPNNNNNCNIISVIPNPPSKVVHIRNIPSNVIEMEIIQLGIPFGGVKNALVLKGKSQAFLEMYEESAAQAMVNYFSTYTTYLRGKYIYVQYSTHKELTTTSGNSNANTPTQAALVASQAMPNASFVGPALQGAIPTVLRVIIENMIYPITLDILHHLFSSAGEVLRIVTFLKRGLFQALIQYADFVSAQTAKLALDTKSIYGNCCTLRIEFSKLPFLNVRFNNDKSHDYTNPTLPSGEYTLDGKSFVPVHTFNSFPMGFPAMHGAEYGCAGFLQPMQVCSNQANGGSTYIPGSVLLVSNLNEKFVSPDRLFTLFGVYGDVMRVKILFNKKDTALIQMREPSHALLALQYLERLFLYSKPMHVSVSKHGEVQMPKEGRPDSGLTKDYINSNLHRFKKPDSKNYNNIYAPNSTLHLSNIPPCVSEQRISELFSENGFTVVKLKLFPTNAMNDKYMALLQLASIETATEALIKMHNHALSESCHLRVSFSKSSI